MTNIKRHLLALAGVLAVLFLLSFLSDLLIRFFASTDFPESASAAVEWQQRAMFGVNLSSVIQMFVAFGVGAYVLKKNALLPGLVLWLVVTAISVSILRDVALPAQPTISHVDVLSQNAVGWAAGLVAAVLGLLAGEQVARKAGTTQDAL